jgi:flavin-dependent dehydrogenase
MDRLSARRPDVIIAGGGVAGASLAILLGRAGLRVTLFDQRTFPSEKPCGEGLMPAGVAVLARLGLLSAVGGVAFSGIRWHAGDRMVEASFPRVPGMPSFGIAQRRLRLDLTLFEAARATSGVTAIAGTRVDAPLVERGRVVGVSAGGDEHRAPLTVIADGAASRLRRALGLDGPRRSRVRVGMRSHFRLSSNQSPPDRVTVFLGAGREVYIAPLPDGELLVAGLAEREIAGPDARAAWSRWITEEPALAALLAGATRISSIEGRAPLTGTARAGVVPGAVLLGDAAGFTDPVTGGGMAQALLAAELLAAHVPLALDRGDAVLRRFDRERRRMLRPFRAVTGLMLALVRRPWLARLALDVIAAHPPLFSRLIGVAGGLSCEHARRAPAPRTR